MNSNTENSGTNGVQQPEWKYLGEGSRYHITRKTDSLVVVVGWDRPLATFFAQVWDVPADATHHEDGTLLLWAGCKPYEIGSVERLEEVLAPYTTVPEELGNRIEMDRLGVSVELLERTISELWGKGAGTEPVIFAYTRKQALEDRVLVDATNLAQNVGISVPTAFTAAAWEFVTTSPCTLDGPGRADAAQRTLGDLVALLERREDGPVDFSFEVAVIDESRAPLVKRLRAVVRPGDDGLPCLTVMMTDED